MVVMMMVVAMSTASHAQVYVGLHNGSVALVDLRRSGGAAVVRTLAGAPLIVRPVHSLEALGPCGAGAQPRLWPGAGAQGAGGAREDGAQQGEMQEGQGGQQQQGEQPQQEGSVQQQEGSEQQQEGAWGADGDVEVLAATTAGVWGLGAGGAGGGALLRPLCTQQEHGGRTCEGMAVSKRTGAVAVSWRAPAPVAIASFGGHLAGAVAAQGGEGAGAGAYHLLWQAAQREGTGAGGYLCKVRRACIHSRAPECAFMRARCPHAYNVKLHAHTRTHSHIRARARMQGLPLTLGGHHSAMVMTSGAFLEDMEGVDPMGTLPPLFFASADEAQNCPCVWDTGRNSIVRLAPMPGPVLQVGASGVARLPPGPS